jgi:hypothetical protein
VRLQLPLHTHQGLFATEYVSPGPTTVKLPESAQDSMQSVQVGSPVGTVAVAQLEVIPSGIGNPGEKLKVCIIIPLMVNESVGAAGRSIRVHGRG